MPFISSKVSVPLTKEKEQVLKTRLGQAITCFPGKTESFLMLDFEDNCRLYFRGEAGPAAFIEVKVFGSLERGACEKMTAVVTDLFAAELGIDPARIYVRYEETEHWGWNGANF